MEQIGEYASRSSTVFLKSQSDPLLHKLEDAVHRIMVRRSAPDWLPLVRGASYWVPPPRSQTHGIAKLVEKLANPIYDEESISISSVQGWPSSDYFIKGVQPQSMETEMASNTASHSEDEEGYLIWSFDVVIFKVSLGNFSLETARFHMMFQNMIQGQSAFHHCVV